MTQARLDFDPPQVPAAFDGATYDKAQDAVRLGRQLQDVLALMSDGSWRTLRQVADALGYPEASISARLRDLRKLKFGGHNVVRQRVNVGRGTWEYRVAP